MIAVLTAGRSDRGLLDILMAEMTRCGLAHFTIGVGEAANVTYMVDTLLASDSDRSVAQSAALAEYGIADVLERAKPDMLLVLGDRSETLAACCAAHTLRIPICHLHGGESTRGSLDDARRDAISMLATLHFVAHQDYGVRLFRMGVRGQIHDTGALGIDDLRIRDVKACGMYDHEQPMVLVSVPEGPEVAAAIAAALAMLDVKRVLWFPPNADAGRHEVSRYATVPSQSRDAYLLMLAEAQVAVGNSSSLVYEAHAVGTPAVLVGDRQEGRVTHDSVVSVPADPHAIAAAIRDAMTREVVGPSPFGDGHAAERMVKLLCAR